MDIRLSVEATRLIRDSRLKKPSIKVNLEYKPPVCTSSFCRKRPYISVSVAEEDYVNEAYVRVTSDSGIPVYIVNPLFELANREGKSVKIETRGVWPFRRLVLEGLDPYNI